MSAKTVGRFKDLSSLVVDDTFVGHSGFIDNNYVRQFSEGEIAYAIAGSLGSPYVTNTGVINYAKTLPDDISNKIVHSLYDIFDRIDYDGMIEHPTNGKRYRVSGNILAKFKSMDFKSVEDMVVDGVFIGHSGITYKDISEAEYPCLVILGALQYEEINDILNDPEELLPEEICDRTISEFQDHLLDIARHGYVNIYIDGSSVMVPVSDVIKNKAEEWYKEQPAFKNDEKAGCAGSFSAVERLVVRGKFSGCRNITKAQLSRLNSNKEKAFAIVGILAHSTIEQMMKFCESINNGDVQELVEEYVELIANNSEIDLPGTHNSVPVHEDIAEKCRSYVSSQSPSGGDVDVEAVSWFNEDLKICGTVGRVFVGYTGICSYDVSVLSKPEDIANAFVGVIHCYHANDILKYIKSWNLNRNNGITEKIFLDKLYRVASTGKITLSDGLEYHASNYILEAARKWRVMYGTKILHPENLKQEDGMDKKTQNLFIYRKKSHKQTVVSSEKESHKQTNKSKSTNSSKISDGNVKMSRYAVSIPIACSSGTKRYILVVEANSYGEAIFRAGFRTYDSGSLNIVDNMECDNVLLTSDELPESKNIIYPSKEHPTFVMSVSNGISNQEAVKSICQKNSLTISSKDDIVALLRESSILLADRNSDSQEKKEGNMPIEKPTNRTISAKSMLIQDAEDAALRATGKAASRFSRRILLDNLIPKIENPIVQGTVKKFIESSWGLSLVNISFGYFYPLIESRIPMSEEVRAFGDIVARHMRRDGLSDVIVDIAAEIAIPIKDFLTEQMNMIPKSQLDKILEEQKVRAVDDAAEYAGSNIELAAPKANQTDFVAATNGKTQQSDFAAAVNGKTKR